MSDPQNLLPCPFCNGAAEFKRIGDFRRSTIVVCTMCQCRLETGEESNHGAAWNRRTTPPEDKRLREALRSKFLCVYLDGRNEHGSHVLEMSGNSILDADDMRDLLVALADQDLGFAEQIITDAEALGYEIGHRVVTLWNSTRDPEWGIEWEYRSISPELTEAMCGSPAEQRQWEVTAIRRKGRLKNSKRSSESAAAPCMKEALVEARKAVVELAERCRDERLSDAGRSVQAAEALMAEEIRWSRIVDKCDAALSKAGGQSK